MIHGLAEVADLAAPMSALDQLLGAERDQHADDDDPDLAGQGAPAVERLWQMDMHGKPPSRSASVGAGAVRSMARATTGRSGRAGANQPPQAWLAGYRSRSNAIASASRLSGA